MLADLFSVLLLLPTLVAGRRGKARTKQRVTRLLTAVGLHAPRWHRLDTVIGCGVRDPGPGGEASPRSWAVTRAYRLVPTLTAVLRTPRRLPERTVLPRIVLW